MDERVEETARRMYAKAAALTVISWRGSPPAQAKGFDEIDRELRQFWRDMARWHLRELEQAQASR